MPVFQASKHDLKKDAASVAALVVSDRFVAELPAWNTGLDDVLMQDISEPVCVIAAAAEQRCRTTVIADLAGSHEEAQRAAIRVSGRMELRVHATFGATNQAAKAPVFAVRPNAARCVSRWRAPIMTVVGSASAAAKPSISRLNT